MILRATTEADLDAILSIVEDGRASLASLGIDQWQNGYPTPDVLLEDIRREHGYIALDEQGNALGIISAIFGGEPQYDTIEGGSWLTDSLSHEPRYCAIHRVAVAKEASGKGVASFMMQSIEDLARDQQAESIRIDTHEGNKPMRQLISKCGYTECGIIFVRDRHETTRERVAYEKLLS